MDLGNGRIKKTEGVCGGSACIRDTRISVWTIINARRLGRSDTEILEDYPGLTDDDIFDAICYWMFFPEEIDNEIEQNEKL